MTQKAESIAGQKARLKMVYMLPTLTPVFAGRCLYRQNKKTDNKFNLMFSKRCILFLLLVSALAACKHEEEVDFDANSCKRIPAFVQALGFNQHTAYFSTSDTKKMGLLLLESPQPGNTAIAPTRVYQHPSWQKGGWLAPIMIDDKGNIFT